VCPVKIDLPVLLLELRARVVRARRTGLSEWLFVAGWSRIMRHPAALRRAGGLLRFVQRLIGRRPPWLPYPFSRWVASRDLPAPARSAFRQRWKP